jgi:peptidyl-prolyl cis-trans isomerase D
MIGGMRKFAKSKWAILLFALLILSFGVFGFSDPFQGVSGGGFVKVDGRSIEQRDITRLVDQELERIRQESGEVLSQRDAAQRGITQQILSGEVYRTSVLAYADEIGVRASISAVNNLLMNNAPRFKDPLGRINIQEVRRYAADQGQTVAQFEKALQDDLTFNYMQTAAFAGVVTPEILSRPLLDYFGEMRTLSVARLTPTSLPEPTPPTDEELRAWYTAHADQFRQPERRRISILTYSAADFTDKVEISDAMIKAEYDRRIRDFSTPQTRNVAQFTGERPALQSFVDTVKQGVALEEALGRSQGVTRTDLTVTPGEIAAMKPGDEDQKTFDDTIFSLPANQIAGPAQVGDAWYVVQVTGITEGVPTPLEQVSDQIRQSIAETEARRMFDATYESFYDMAGGVSLEEMGKEIGAPVIELAPVNANGQTMSGAQSSLLARNPEAFRSLFSLGAGQMTDVIEGDGERTIMRVDEVVAPFTLPFEEVQADVRTRYLREKLEEEADRLANGMVAAVKAGTPFEQAADANRMAALGAVEVMREPPRLDAQVLAAAYNLKLDDVAVVKGQNNEPWVVRVDKITPATSEVEASLKPQIDSQIAESLLNDLREVFARGVQKEVQVRPNEKAISAYFENLTKDETQ